MRRRLGIGLLWILWPGFGWGQPAIVSFRASNGLQDSTFELYRPIRLNYRQTHLTIAFRDSTHPNAHHEYRLVGDDARWYACGAAQSVSYANLFGGAYRFEVRSAAQPSRVARLAFTLEEAFWQRGWFVPALVAYGLLVVGVIVYAITLYKLRGQLRLQQLRNDIAADLHDDVGSTLSTISFLGELAKRKFPKHPEASLPLLETMLHEARLMVQTLRGVVWTISPGNDHAADFLEKLKPIIETLLGSRTIALTFQHNVPADVLLSVEQQRHLFLVVKEISHNIAKHAGAGHVTFYARKHQHFLWIGLTDDGVGFDPAGAFDGNGLRNLHRRVAELEGKLDIDSGPGRGTSVRLMIPL
jgi:signal transduction histidine kinase